MQFHSLDHPSALLLWQWKWNRLWKRSWRRQLLYPDRTASPVRLWKWNRLWQRMRMLPLLKIFPRLLAGLFNVLFWRMCCLLAGILFSSFALLFFSYIRHLSHRTHFLLLQFSVSSPGLSFLDTFYFMILEEKGQNPHVPAYKRMHDLAKMLYRIHIPRILAYLTEREILAGDRMMEEQQEESYPLTPIDKIANGNSLLILKALLPYLPSQKQAGAAFLVKWMEIQNIRNYYHTHPAADLTAMALPSHSVTDLFQSIAPFCRRGQREMMEQFQSMMEMMKLLETMQDFSGGENNDEQSESGFRKSTEWITEPEQNLMDE